MKTRLALIGSTALLLAVTASTEIANAAIKYAGIKY
jgi:hypothetical protein